MHTKKEFSIPCLAINFTFRSYTIFFTQQPPSAKVVLRKPRQQVQLANRRNQKLPQ